MTKKEHENFILMLYNEAKDSTHPFPEYSVFEGVLETAWGQSKLFKEGLNVFGLKQSKSNPRFETLTYSTKEFINGQWVTEIAEFIKYPSIKDSFNDRTNTLIRLSSTYQEYKNALAARNGEEFIKEVSRKWSTDPLRSEKVLDLYNNYKYVFDTGQDITSSGSNILTDFWKDFSNKFKKT